MLNHSLDQHILGFLSEASCILLDMKVLLRLLHSLAEPSLNAYTLNYNLECCSSNLLHMVWFKWQPDCFCQISNNIIIPANMKLIWGKKSISLFKSKCCPQPLPNPYTVHHFQLCLLTRKMLTRLFWRAIFCRNCLSNVKIGVPLLLNHKICWQTWLYIVFTSHL